MMRAIAIAWAFTRHGLLWTVYRDVVRRHMSNPDCECAEDRQLAGRAERLRIVLENLGPTFIKLGQFLSRRPDLLPAPYIAQLSKLQEATPPIPFPLIRRRIEEICICSHRDGTHEPRLTCLHCRRIEGVFDSFDPIPVASGSLAQVHRAVYEGKAVAVKVLKPGVLDRLNADLPLLRRLQWFVGRALGISRNMPVGEFVEEFRRRLLGEVNFEDEALNMERFRDNHAGDDRVSVPAVYWEFDRSDLLVLEFADGTSLRTWRGTSAEARQLATTIAEDFVRQVFLHNFFHADPHPGNLFIVTQDHITYLDFGTMGQLDPRTRKLTLTLLRSILNDDSELAARAVLELGGTEVSPNKLKELRLDLDRIIQLCRRRGGARWTDAIIETARRHGIRLPSSIILYAKAAILNESLVTELDPDFKVLPVVKRMLVPILEKEVLAFPRQLQRDLPELTRRYAEVLLYLHDLIRDHLSTRSERPDDR